MFFCAGSMEGISRPGKTREIDVNAFARMGLDKSKRSIRVRLALIPRSALRFKRVRYSLCVCARDRGEGSNHMQPLQLFLSFFFSFHPQSCLAIYLTFAL